MHLEPVPHHLKCKSWRIVHEAKTIGQIIQWNYDACREVSVAEVEHASLGDFSVKHFASGRITTRSTISACMNWIKEISQ